MLVKSFKLLVFLYFSILCTFKFKKEFLEKVLCQPISFFKEVDIYQIVKVELQDQVKNKKINIFGYIELEQLSLPNKYYGSTFRIAVMESLYTVD